LQSGPDESDREAENRGEGEDEEIEVRREGSSRAGESGRREERHHEQEPLARKAVAEGRCEWRYQSRRQQADEAGDSDAGRAAVLVGKDAEGDEVRPLGGDRSAPCQLHPPDVAVAESGGQSREHLPEANHPAIEPASGRNA
jgi:hypothetical protein